MHFSVLMSVYKSEKPRYFKTAVDSVINQSVRPSEIVIVQDGKLTNELYSVCDELKRSYEDLIKYVVLEKNVGLGKALQIGVENCKYELIARMDTDDIAKKDRFELQLSEFKKNSELGLCGGIIEEFSDSPDNVNSTRKVPLTCDAIYAFAQSRNPFNHMTVMFRKSTVLKAGNYQTMHLCEDYYLWYRTIKNNVKMCNLPNVLVSVRADNKMFERRGGWKYFLSEYKLQKKFLESGFISTNVFILNILTRFLVRILPNKIRCFFYKKVVRR